MEMVGASNLGTNTETFSCLNVPFECFSLNNRHTLRIDLSSFLGSDFTPFKFEFKRKNIRNELDIWMSGQGPVYSYKNGPTQYPGIFQ